MKKIPLTQGKFAIVDSADYEWLMRWKWYFENTGYATRKYGKKIYMHSIINKTPKGMSTDHINRDRLDNRRSNLRTVTQRQNLLNTGLFKNNTSGHRGVVFGKRDKNWIAQIKVNQRNIFLGYFDKIEDAIFARKQAEVKYAEY